MESVVFASVNTPIVPIPVVADVMALPPVLEKTAILLMAGTLAGPVTTSKDETVESSKDLFVKENIGSFPYVGKVAQLNILSAVLE